MIKSVKKIILYFFDKLPRKTFKRIFAATFIVFILLISLLRLKVTYNAHFSDNSSLDYKVYLKKNDYYQTNFLEKSELYIPKYIDYIDSSFKYNYNGKSKIDGDFEYYIIGKFKVNGSSKVYYENEEYLLDKKKIKVNDNKFNINENIKIDYSKYNKLANDYFERYDDVSDVTLSVNLYVKVNGRSKDFSEFINGNRVIGLDIPLGDVKSGVSFIYDLSNNSNNTLKYRCLLITNKGISTFIVFLIVICVLLLILFSSYVILSIDNKSLYRAKLNRILKNYDRFLSRTVEQPIEEMMKTRSLRIVFIESFNDLLEIRSKANKKILYQEISDKETIFYLLTKKIGYVYVMSVNNYHKKKKSNIGLFFDTDSIDNSDDIELLDLEEYDIEELEEIEDYEIIDEEII